MKRSRHVVAEKFRIAENHAGPRIVVAIPGGQRQERKQKRIGVPQMAANVSCQLLPGFRNQQAARSGPTPTAPEAPGSRSLCSMPRARTRERFARLLPLT